MRAPWTIGWRLGVGFAATVSLTTLAGAVSSYALHDVVEAKDRVLAEHAATLVEAAKLDAAAESMVAASRAFLLTGDEAYVERGRSAEATVTEGLDRLRGTARGAEALAAIEGIAGAHAGYRSATDAMVALRRTDATLEAVVARFESDVQPQRRLLAERVDALVGREEGLLQAAQRAASDRAAAASAAVVAIVVATVLLASTLALVLTRTLTRQIGSAVQHIQSSSAELQAASAQQAAGAKEQAMATSEITTTIRELLSTSRQIAASAQGVARIAQETAVAAQAGGDTVQLAQEAAAAMKRQVEAVVSHMLELGRKSQHMGSILEIVNELAEQTNILSINATIEAAGAGDAGRRFAAVADEIRKLADRVGGSTREIRGLTDDIRSAVHTTVMATEAGSKSVDVSSRQVAEVASAFRRIAGQAATSAEAGREIELSTKQQATAVEQVNLAIGNVAQAAKETEASSAQTVATAGELAGLSRELTKLIHAESPGGTGPR